MTETDMPPPIPGWLADQPTVGGLVVPWVTPRTADGRFLFGVVDTDRVRYALHGRRCGVCGRPLDDGRLVLLLRSSDLPRRCTPEPTLHPVCAQYTVDACPMVAGRLTHYRSRPPRLDASMQPVAQSPARLGAAAQAWFQIWLRGYRVDHEHGHLVASYRDTPPLRIRPITWRQLGLL